MQFNGNYYRYIKKVQRTKEALLLCKPRLKIVCTQTLHVIDRVVHLAHQQICLDSHVGGTPYPQLDI